MTTYEWGGYVWFTLLSSSWILDENMTTGARSCNSPVPLTKKEAKKWNGIASRTSHIRIDGRPYEHNSVSQHQGCQIRGAWGADNGRHDRRSSSPRSPDWHVAARMFGSSWRHGREPANSRSSAHTIPSWSARVQQQPAIGAWERQRQRLARHSYLTSSHTCEFQARKMEFQRLLQVWVQFEGFVKTLNPNEMLSVSRTMKMMIMMGIHKGSLLPSTVYISSPSVCIFDKVFASFWKLTCKKLHKNKMHVNWHAQF